MPDTPSAPPFTNLRPFETLLLAQVDSAATDYARTTSGDAQRCGDAEVRGGFLAWLLATAVPQRAPALATLDVLGATIVDPLPLAGLRLAVTPRFIGCDFAALVELTNATVVGLEFIGCTLRRIDADRLTASGQVHFRAIEIKERDSDPDRARFAERKSIVVERVRLCGANIRGNLDLRGTILEGRTIGPLPPLPLHADGIVVGGNMLLSEEFQAVGEVRLNGCRIDRNLDLNSATLTAGRELKSERVLSFSAAW
ncbi:MAG: hypothetical protein HY060_13075, partial [Proteobacteria bacterium]|nr:hypothetical protein [Pseudomonadota bacterium]